MLAVDLKEAMATNVRQQRRERLAVEQREDLGQRAKRNRAQAGHWKSSRLSPNGPSTGARRAPFVRSKKVGIFPASAHGSGADGGAALNRGAGSHCVADGPFGCPFSSAPPSQLSMCPECPFCGGLSAFPTVQPIFSAGRLQHASSSASIAFWTLGRLESP